MNEREYRADQLAAVACEMARLDLVNVVRCKDCDFYDHWDTSEPYREKHVCGYWDYLEIEPDGYCAWGERRDDA